MKKIILPILVVALALAGIVYKLNSNKAKNQEDTKIVAQQNAKVAVRSVVASVQEVDIQYISNGTFKPEQEVRLSAETPGRVQKVLVKEGDYVKAGQVLAVIKADKVNVQQANAQALYNDAKSEVERFESAFKTGGVTKQQLDKVKLQLETATNNLKASQLYVSDAQVTASFSGIINRKSVEAGSFVAPGQELFEIVDVSKLKLKVTVDEKNIGYIKLGQEISIAPSVNPEQKYKGKVTFIAPKADASLNFPVELQVTNNSDNNLRAGMYATVFFGKGDKTKVLSLPREAFVGSVSSNEVFVIENAKAVLKKVTSGRNFGSSIEILSGVSEGDQVIVSGQINLSNQTPVEVIK